MSTVRSVYPALENRPRSYWVAIAAAILAACGCIYYWMFSRFSPWDDDGYILISIQSMLKGNRLYNDIYSQYGPFYYLVHWITYSVIGQPVSHDVERIIGTALWLLSAIFWARTSYLLTNSLAWSGLSFFLGVKLLEFFPWSAGHPEELCMALLAAIAALACGLKPATIRRDAVLLGCLVAALLVTKVNIGIFIGVAVGLLLLRTGKPGRWQQIAENSLAIAALIMPAALMFSMFQFDWARNYALVATSGIGAAIFLTRKSEPVIYMNPRAWRAAAIAFVACLLAVILPFSLHGTTLVALLRMTLLQHAGTARNWYLVAHIGARVVLCMVASLALLALSYRQRRAVRSAEWLRYILIAVKLGVGFVCLSALTTRNIRADNPLVFCYCVPFVWLILDAPVDETANRTRAGRMALCLLAVFAYLYAYPVAGAQVLFASIPSGIIAVVLLRDAFSEIAGTLPAGWLPPQLLRAAPAVGFFLVAALFSLEIYDGYHRWASGVSLGMPGATRIRVEPSEAATYRWIASNVDSCTALYSMPGQFSLNFWTALKSPTNLTAGNWVGLLDAQQQRSVIQDLSAYPKLCIVYNPALVEVWRRGQDLSKSPLAQYIRREFVTAAAFDGYFILKRK